MLFLLYLTVKYALLGKQTALSVTFVIQEVFMQILSGQSISTKRTAPSLISILPCKPYCSKDIISEFL